MPTPASNRTLAPSASPLGNVLRRWRDVRGKSQLQLSLDSGVSQRHLSFIESGRSAPSREMLSTLSDALGIPFRERNELLLAAGYAPAFSEAPWDAQEMRSITSAVERMLRQQEPYPALLMDRYWNVLRPNEAARRFFGSFIDLEAFPPPRNILQLTFDPTALRPHVADWERTAASLLQRVRREAVGNAIDERLAALLDKLLGYPDVKPEWQLAGSGSTLPMIPVGFIKGRNVLNYFSLVATVGSPQTVTAQELRVECMFPADEATERAHMALFPGAAS